MNDALLRELTDVVAGAGIDMVGVTSAEPLQVRAGVFPHRQPREVLPGARAVVLAGFCVAYRPRLVPSTSGTPRGRFTPYGSRAYAQMSAHCGEFVGGFLRGKGWQVEQTGRIPEKPAAVRAGLGRYGKHGVVTTPALGSWVMFASFVTDAPLATTDDDPRAPGPCPANCDLCLRACPTGAITAPYEVDRARCITNWLWGYSAPRELRDRQENRLFGCGECLIACPRSKGVPPRQAYPVPIDDVSDSPELIPLVDMDDDHFRRTIPRFAREAGTAAMRGNAIIALGNIGDPAAVAALGRALQGDNSQNRGYSAWALGRIGGAPARALLETARTRETVPAVLDEITCALDGIA